MIGVAIGDIAGSIYEFCNHKSKDFPLFGKGCSFTDDTIMAVAVADALLKVGTDPDSNVLRKAFVESMRAFGSKYPNPMGGYGGRFGAWLVGDNTSPYNSWGNGAPMRVAACGFAAETLDEAYRLARCSAEVTHNHPEGIKGAQCVAGCIWMARHGYSKDQIKEEVDRTFYRLAFKVDQIRKKYAFNESSQGTVPPAIQAFLESDSFVDSIRNAISLGGDSDTLAAINGGIAEAFYGVPDNVRVQAESRLTSDLLDVIKRFEARYQR